METSVWIAQLLGLVYLAVAVGFIVDKKYYQKMLTEWAKGGNPMTSYLGGIIAAVIGFVLVSYHNVWDGPFWVSVISLVGWLALIKGLALLIAPTMMSNLFKPMVKNAEFMKFMTFVAILVGLFFSYHGYLA